MNIKYEYKKWLFYLGLLLFSLLSTLMFSTQTFAEGSGTEEDPYLVNNSEDLKSYLALGNNSSDTLYIQLTGDITYTDRDQFTIYSNVVVNGLKDGTAGSYYKMLKTGASNTTSTAGFYLNASGYNVVFENMSFGDDSYSYNQTYYGILLGYNSQVNFTVKNVDYYGSSGGQPFCNYNTQSTFTFDGINNFNVQAGPYSQEFLEGTTVAFAEGSTTNISHMSRDMYSIFYNTTASSQMDITIGANATVNIVTNKNYLTSNSRTVNFTMGDSATFIYSGTSYGFNFVNISSYQSNYTIGNNATFAVSGAGKIENSNTATANFTVTDPAEISFENTLGTGLFNSSVLLSPTTQADYAFDYIVGGQSITKKADTASMTLTDSSFDTNLTKLIYSPAAIASFDATGDVTNASGDVNATSVINVSNIAISNAYSLSNVEYKIFSTSPLADGSDITTTESQEAITNSSNANYSSSISTNSFSIDQVPAGTYTIFLRVTGNSSSNRITQTSQWVAKTVTLGKSILNVIVPTEMAFSVIDNAAFTSPNTYDVTNLTNYGITFGIDSVTEVSDITLVENIDNSDATNPLYLALKGETDGTTLPFVTTVSPKPTFSVSPFTDPYSFQLIGQYGGTLNTTGVRDFQYTLTYVIGNE